MSNRRDQYQGYRFVMRRQAGALLRSDPDSAGGTLRRLSDGVLASVAAAVLVAAGVGIYGALHPSAAAKSWLNGKTLIVDETSASRYLWLDGSLHPVLNYASALLVLKSGAVSATRVSHSAVEGEPQGAPVGIPGAPDTVPAAGRLASSAWSACSVPATDAQGAAAAQVVVSLGAAPAGTAIPADSGLLVSGPAGGEFLVWNGTRLQIPDSAAYALVVLGAAASTPVPVGDAWLNAVPRGRDLVAPAIADLGKPGPRIGGQSSALGQVYEIAATASYYAAEASGPVAVTPLQAQLLMAERGQPSPTPLTAAQVPASAATGTAPAGSDGLPASVPKLVAAQPEQTAVCAAVVDASQGSVTVTTHTAAPKTSARTAARAPVGALQTPIADEVDVPSGHGALVRAAPGPGVTSGAMYLVTEAGIAYPIGTSGNVLTDLGLSQAAPSAIPQSLLALIPAGPTLDEQAALATQTVNPGSASHSSSAPAAP